MPADQKKKNTYTILFFLAILFVAIGFERSGTVSGFYSRQSVVPETWSLACDDPTLDVASEDLADTLYDTFGCQRGKTATYCRLAAEGADLPRRIRVRVSCASSAALQEFIQICEESINTRCASRRR